MTDTQRQSAPCACGGCGCTGCGCCAGIAALTPEPTANRPGLSSLRYRIGTHGSFLQTMLALLSSHALPAAGTGLAPARPLAGLGTRDPGDPAIALLDAWATVADVLTFYQERIANEGYLRTATELRSLFELARLVGYRPRPGVAASVYLAYTIDPNTPQEIVVPKGARAQTVPGQDELPQSFETVEDLRARAAWNRLGLRRAAPQQWNVNAPPGVLYLAGTQTLLKVGDPLLIELLAAARPPLPYRVLRVDAEAEANRTAVQIEQWATPAPSPAPPPAPSAAQSLEDRITQLVKPPSVPRANALQLPRSLSASFQPTGDAGLKLLAATAPRLRDTLAPALAGFQAASSPLPFRVWAPRLQAGPFGRAFPRPTRVELAPAGGEFGAQSSKTVDDGDWPIVTAFRNGAVVATEQTDILYLDASYDNLAPGSWVFVDASTVDTNKVHDDQRNKDFLPMVLPAQPLLVTQVRQVNPKVARAAYGGSGDTTRLALGKPWLAFHVDNSDMFGTLSGIPAVREREFGTIRGATVYAASELMPLADQPIAAPLCDGTAADGPIELDGLYTGLEPGRFVIVSGERADVPATSGVFASEAAMITEVVHDVRAAGTPQPFANVAMDPKQIPLAGDAIHTFIRLDKPLAFCYQRASVAIAANVVAATHGETHVEVLGNGNGATPLQRFELKHAPLTYVPAATLDGIDSTLSVYVNDVRWHESSAFYGHAAADRIYMLQADDKEKSAVQFGNGREGARPPTGIGNLKAVYRSGIGTPGNVRAGQIQQLATRPLGVKDVTNPLRASGGADREGDAQLRHNLPLAVKSLDRLVSTPDYADFARTFAGIGKADAQRLSDGRRTLVHLTVAGIDDGPLDSDSRLLANLRRALRQFGDPFLPLAVEPRELLLLLVSAGLRIDADHLWEPVATQARTALLDAFGFTQRELAQGAASSEALAVLQAVPGVLYVDLDVFGAIETVGVNHGVRLPKTPEETAKAVAAAVHQGVVPAVQARRARRAPGGALQPAQLLLLSGAVPDTLVLNQIA
jgi:hypothetical protein